MSLEIFKVNSKFLGYFLIIISAALYALTHVIGKPLLESNEIEMNPVVLAATIYFINGLFFTPLSKRSTPFHQIDRKSLFFIILVGMAEVSALITYFFGLKDSTAINASIFSNGEIIFSLLIAIIIFKEKLHQKELVPFAMIIFGMMVIPIGYDFYTHGMNMSPIVLGDVLIILSGLFYAVDVNLCKYVSNKISSYRITQLLSFSAGLFALMMLFIFQIPFDIQIEHLPSITLIAILGTGMATVFFLLSLKLIGAIRTVLIYSSTSVFGIIFSAILIGEEITIMNTVSIGAVLLGIYMLRARLGDETPQNLTKIPKKIGFQKILDFF